VFDHDLAYRHFAVGEEGPQIWWEDGNLLNNHSPAAEMRWSCSFGSRSRKNSIL
jgi:hypothetical protein